MSISCSLNVKSIQSNVFYEVNEHTKSYKLSVYNTEEKSQIYKHLLESYRSGYSMSPNVIF